MKNIVSVIRRFVGMMLLSFLLLVAANLFLFGLFAGRQLPNGEPWTMAQRAADALQPAEGGYTLPQEMLQQLQAEDIWAVFIDNEALQVVWQTGNLPESIPASYTAADIAQLVRGYVENYPTFTGTAENGLMVLGYPQQSYWKHLWPSWDYRLIAHLPQLLFAALLMNLALICLIYFTANSRLLKSIRPLTDGLQELGACRPVYIRQGGPLSEIARNINRASERLQSQSYQLRRRETARANWIAGVSHDIRTPLSMVMGYAAGLQGDAALPGEARQKASIILKQSERIKKLIDNLNLASRLEYNMQPLKRRPVNAVALVRQAAVDLLNLQEEGRYTIEWETQKSLSACMVQADSELLHRAVVNLLQNSIHHNEGGCTLYVSVGEEKGRCAIAVEDDGVGVSQQQLEQLRSAPHAAAWGSGMAGQCHGLGLLIARQVAASHGGRLELGQSRHGGFAALLLLPVWQGEDGGSPPKAQGGAG